MTERSVLAHLLFAALLALALGPPIKTWPEFLILFLGGVGCIYGRLGRTRSHWLVAVGVAVCPSLVGALLDPPRILESSNVFVGSAEGQPSTLQAGLPPRVFEYLDRSYVALYAGYTKLAPDAVLYRKSADDWRAPPGTSRRVGGIEFENRYAVHLGAVNQARYNTYGAMLPRRDELPYFLRYEFPAEYAGARLCWTGDVFWETEQGMFEKLAANGCRRLQPRPSGGMPVVFGVEVYPQYPLSMSLSSDASLTAPRLLEHGLRLVAALMLIALLVRVRGPIWRLALLPSLSLLSTVVAFARKAPGWREGFVVFEGGNDGLTYASSARLVMESVAAGDWVEAMRAGVDVFYNMPGYRYAQALQLSIFGETQFGVLLVVALFPLALLALLRAFLPPKYALTLIALFVCIPVLENIGFFHYYYVSASVRGFGEPLAYALALVGMLIATMVLKGEQPTLAAVVICGMTLALAVVIRPNIALAAAVFLASAGFTLLGRRAIAKALALGLGFAPVLLPALHNYFFGDAFFLFTSTADNPSSLRVTPGDYADVLIGLVSVDGPGAAGTRVLAQLGSELAPREGWRYLFILAGIVGALGRGVPVHVRALAFAGIAQMGLFLFYKSGGRYGWWTWAMLLIVATWIVWQLQCAVTQRRERPGAV